MMLLLQQIIHSVIVLGIKTNENSFLTGTLNFRIRYMHDICTTDMKARYNWERGKACIPSATYFDTMLLQTTV